jgi:hypothetical protein
MKHLSANWRIQLGALLLRLELCVEDAPPKPMFDSVCQRHLTLNSLTSEDL